MLRCLHVHHGRWSSILHLFLRLISFLFFSELVLRLSYMQGGDPLVILPDAVPGVKLSEQQYAPSDCTWQQDDF